LTIFAALELSDTNNMSRRLPLGWLSFFMKELHQFELDASLVRKRKVLLLISSFPESDFNKTPLSRSARRQLAEIVRTISRPDGAGRAGLRNLILRNVFDLNRGTYVPLAQNFYLKGKLPDVSRTLVGLSRSSDLVPFPAPLFTNVLLIPEGYGADGFRSSHAPKPLERATNIGFLIVTIEFDCRRPEQLEENLTWTRSANGDGDFFGSPFAELDWEFRRVKEYRGFSIVFSGNKSLHFHFVFSTEHLLNVPCGAVAEDRLQDFRRASAVLHNAHKRYWDHVHDEFLRILKPSVAADPQLRSLTQWRRAPWGIRLLTEDSVLGFSRGTRVPQLVIREKLLQRAPKGNDGFLVPESFSSANPVRMNRPRSHDTDNIAGFDEPSMIDLLEEICSAEWGEWPKPVGVGIQDGEWVFRFRNHQDDRNPSTIALGDHRRLQLNGQHGFEQRQFYLPDQMTAQDLGNHLAERLGWQPLDENPAVRGRPTQETNGRIQGPGFEGFSRPCRVIIQGAAGADRDLAKRAYRDVLGREMAQRSDLGMVSIVTSVEGIGKTTAGLPILANEALEDALAHNDGVERFSAFAFRSRNQANEKAQEFGRTHRVRVIKTFWEHYTEACLAEGQVPIPRDEFDDVNPSDILLLIRQSQPDAFALLERVRADLWTAPTRFDGGSTLLCLTHRAAQLWPSGVLTRAWHHPDFDPLGSDEHHAALRDRFRLNRIVFDDCEGDDFVHTLPELAFEFLSRQQARHPDWRNTPRSRRLAVYRHLLDDIPHRQMPDFDSFDELMRLDLNALEPIQVDFDAIPFGYDNSKTGIYRQRHGEKYYLGPKPWLTENRGEFTFLTTESLVEKVIERAFQKIWATGRPGRRRLTKFALDQVPPIYPVKVPVLFDRRAAADRPGGNRISALAADILADNDNGLVIADGVGGVEPVLTFQGMKGQNGFAERDISIILTCLNPEKFAELNVIGQWLGIEDIIDRYYDDQLNQAVGRNRGFRLSDRRPTTTRVITSSRLWQQVLRRRQNRYCRTQLYIAVA